MSPTCHLATCHRPARRNKPYCRNCPCGPRTGRPRCQCREQVVPVAMSVSQPPEPPPWPPDPRERPHIIYAHPMPTPPWPAMPPAPAFTLQEFCDGSADHGSRRWGTGVFVPGHGGYHAGGCNASLGPLCDPSGRCYIVELIAMIHAMEVAYMMMTNHTAWYEDSLALGTHPGPCRRLRLVSDHTNILTSLVRVANPHTPPLAAGYAELRRSVSRLFKLGKIVEIEIVHWAQILDRTDELAAQWQPHVLANIGREQDQRSRIASSEDQNIDIASYDQDASGEIIRLVLQPRSTWANLSASPSPPVRTWLWSETHAWEGLFDPGR